MARNIGVLIRQRKLVGNCNHPCFPGLVHHRNLVSSSIQTLSLISIPSSTPSTAIIPRSSTPKLPFSSNYNYYSLHPGNLSHSYDSDSDYSDSDSDYLDSDIESEYSASDLPNVVVVPNPMLYNEALGKVKDEGISAVFLYIAPCCWQTIKLGINTFFYGLSWNSHFCNISLSVVYVQQDGMEMTSDKLGVKPTMFHFYLKGKKVDELASGSLPHFQKTFDNVYNRPYLEKTQKRRTRTRKDKNDEGVDLSQLVEVLPSSFPASSIPKVMEVVESLPWEAESQAHNLKPYEIFERKLQLRCFAKGLFLSQEKRERFCSIEDPDLKLEWLKREAE